ncbi:MAG: hypothetical protein AAF497_21665, partial [Planctomycetota bacterium]
LSSGNHPNTDPPWLALLLFHDTEVPKVVPTTVGALPTADKTTSPWQAGIGTEKIGLHDSDQVRLIEIDKQLLDRTKMLPEKFEYDQHVRIRLEFLDALTLSSPSDATLQTKLGEILSARKVDLGAHAKVHVLEANVRWRISDPENRQEYEVRNEASTTFKFFKVAHERAVVIGSRLPKPGARNVVHLVSLEHCYTGTSGTPPYTFKFHNAAATDKIRFVTLHSWELFCDTPAKNFVGLLKGLNRYIVKVENDLFELGAFPSVATNETLTVSKSQILDASKNTIGYIVNEHGWSASFNITWDESKGQWRAPSGSSTASGSVLDMTQPTSANFCLPEPAKAYNDRNVKQRLGAGFVPMRQFFRQGDRSVGWYHGPLISGSGPIGDDQWRAAKTGELVVNTADQLLLFDKTTGLFDTSYAAAWQLGRMLTLRNRETALALYQWKRRHASSLHDARMLMDYGYDLPVEKLDALSAETTPKINRWIEELSLLEHVPFDYLVPDERLLPIESIRFFDIDPLWIECLRDGAFSIGRVLAADYDKDADLLQPTITETGVVVSGDSNSVRLAASSSLQTSYYNHCRIFIPALGEWRLITQYDGATQTATVNRQWSSSPIAGQKYEISIFSNSRMVVCRMAGTATAGNNQIYLNPDDSAVDDVYNNCEIRLTDGPGKGQTRRIKDYDGLTHCATVNSAWGVNPTAQTKYEIYRPVRPM